MNPDMTGRILSRLLLIPALLVCICAAATIKPAPGAELNYTQVLFEYPEVKGADRYVIIIENDGRGAETLSFTNTTLALVVDSGLQFANRYRWHYQAFRNKQLVFTSEVFYFSIGSTFQTGSLWFKAMAEETDPSKYKKGIIFLDYLAVAVNRKGEPVWYLPVNKDSLEKQKTRNIKLTPSGTITYLDNTDCFEKDITGEVLWKAPNDGQVSGDKQEYYHHDFFKMNDGSYLTSGYRFVQERNLLDTNQPCRFRYNTLIQYNKNGEVSWYWDESKHVSKKVIWGDNGPYADEVTGTHLNGVAYYPPDDAFILSFRDNSSVLKISHATGKVLYNLGDSLLKYNPGKTPFSGQHGPSLLRNGGIVVYNNNLERSGKSTGPSYPVIRVYSQPSAKKQSALTWEYECVSPKYPDGIRGKEGYASQLPYSDNLLVCMGGANFIFEVTPAKKVVWQCAFQRYDEGNAQWLDVNNYRCSYAASLYPCYFTLQHGAYNSKSNIVSLTLNNEGTEDDRYTVSFYNEKGEQAGKPQTISVQAGKSKPVSMRVTANMFPVKVQAVSVTNPSLIKEMIIEK